jgi:hypothetical protein
MAMLRCNEPECDHSSFAGARQPAIAFEPVTGVGTSWSIVPLQPAWIPNNGRMQ